MFRNLRFMLEMKSKKKNHYQTFHWESLFSTKNNQFPCMLCNLCLYLPSYIYEYVGFSRRQKQFLGNAEVRTFPDFWRCDTIVLSTHTTTYLLTYIAFNRDDGGHRQVSFAFLSLHHHTLLMLQFFWPWTLPT